MKMRRLNLVLFSAVVAFIVSLPIVFGDRYLPRCLSPWQLQPFNADSLSSFYKANYGVYGESSLIDRLSDTSGTIVEVLVDGWGVPYDESLLVQDFALFEGLAASYAVHRRMFNYTAFAEGNEYRDFFAEGLVLHGDGSDEENLSILDSLLADGSWKRLAWTTRQTREGDRDSLGLVLRGLAEISKRRPEVQFVIQGTHRPILGTPETRRKYLSPWVPAVFVNATLKAAKPIE